MKMNWKKYMAATAAAVMTAGLLGGCAEININDPSSQVVATYGDENIYLDEAKFLAKYNQYQMEATYGSIMMMMGASTFADYWAMDPYGTGTTMEQEAKQSTMQQILQTRVLCDKAEADGITLTEEETAKVTEAVDAFMAEENLVEVTGATRELTERIYTQNALANKVYESMVEDVDTNVDENEFLRKTMEYIKITEKTDTSSSEETTAASETESQSASEETQAETEGASEEELKTQMLEAADAIQAQMEEGTDLEDIEEDYADAAFDVNSFQGIAISANDTEEYKTTAWGLSADQCAVVDVEDDAIYVVHLLNDKDEDRTQAAIDTEIENRTAELFAERYEELASAAPDFKVKDDVWDTVTYSEAAYVEETTAAAAEETAAEETESDETQAAETTEVSEETESTEAAQ
mgnify:FL=1